MPQQAPAEADSDVYAVAYGDEVHVYPASHHAKAVAVYTVGVGAYGEGEIQRVDAGRWAVAAGKLRGMGIPVKDHRTSTDQ